MKGEGGNPDPPFDLGFSTGGEQMSQEIYGRQRIKNDLMKSQEESFKRDCYRKHLQQITHIEPRIHRIKLFGADRSRGAYNWDQVCSQLRM